ncbi:hypothetical protein ACWEQO_22780 [Streptomyces sp. NPDC004051]
MEQRIGSSSQPLEGAGFDPAFIPGLTAPASDRKADVKDEVEPEDPKAASEQADADTAAESENASPEKPEAADAADASGAADASDGSDAVDASDASEEESAPDGPVFEASDRRARIVADHSGVRLRLDDQECEFRWDEIGAVETETARFGKRYTVTVHTTERRWYPLEIEAASRSRFAAWDTELDAVLDAYFDDEATEPETSDADATDTDATEADASDAGADADKPAPDAEAGEPTSEADPDESEPSADVDEPEPEADKSKSQSQSKPKSDAAPVE